MSTTTAVRPPASTAVTVAVWPGVGLALDQCAHAPARGGAEVAGVGQGEAPFSGGGHDGPADGVLAGAFRRRRQAQDVVGPQVGKDPHVRDLRGALGESAGLVEGYLRRLP